MAVPKAVPAGNGLYEQFKPEERLTLLLEALARGDEAEVDRLLRSCPRKDYRCPDAEFDDRRSMAMDIAMVACADLTALKSQLQVLHWAKTTIDHFAPLHHINTSLAFVDGTRCAQGLSQSPFFKRKLGLAGEADEEEANDEDTEIESDEGAVDEEETDEEPPPLKEDQCERMEAVEKRAEQTTRLVSRILDRAARDIATELKSMWEAFSQVSRTRFRLPPEKVLDAIGYPDTATIETSLERYKDLPVDEQSMARYRDGLCVVWDRRFGDGH